MCTTQAPHWLGLQPIWVPVRPRWSRNRWTSSVRSSTSAETALPFTVILTVDTLIPPRFLIGPIRGTAGRLGNTDFRSEGDAISQRVVPAKAGTHSLHRQ